MSVVKYSKRDYTFKPFGAPFGGTAGLCSPLAVAAMGGVLFASVEELLLSFYNHGSCTPKYRILHKSICLLFSK